MVSPQISGWLRGMFPSDPDMQVSAETIYRSLFGQSRGVLKRGLIQQLRRQHHFRHARASARARPRPGQIVDAVSIRQRPAEIHDLVRLPNKDTHTVTRALARRIRRLPQGLMKSLTWDRGTELAAHRAFTLATNVQVDFCDPRSPWQRGSNENTNGLLRQYLPPGADLSDYSQTRL